MNKIQTYKCVRCGKIVDKKKRNKGVKYCSFECFKKRGKSNKTGIEFGCHWCGKKSRKPPSHLKKHNFCSFKCFIKWKKRNNKVKIFNCRGCGKKVSKKYTKHGNFLYCTLDCFRKSKRPDRMNGKMFDCKWCGSKIYRTPSQYEDHKHLFCNHECHNNYQGSHRIKCNCKMCGKQFARTKSNIKRGNCVYCSNECARKDPLLKKRLLQMNIDQQCTKINKLEKRGYKMMEEMKIQFIPQYLIGDKFLVDAFVRSFNLIVQFDGDYWHGNPEKFLVLNEIQKRRRRIDVSQNKYFEKCGYNVLRIWESKIENFKDDLNNCISKINTEKKV
jgi:very-short-patch-repair endonuclease